MYPLKIFQNYNLTSNLQLNFALNSFKSNLTRFSHLRYGVRRFENTASSAAIHEVEKKEKICGSWSRQHRPSSKVLEKLLKRNVNIEVFVSEKSVEMLCSTLSMDAQECKEIVKHKEFQFVSEERLAANARLLRFLHVTSEHVRRAPWILWQDGWRLEEKLEGLVADEGLFETPLHALGFTIYERELVHSYKVHFQAERTDYPEHRNKIYYIGDKLELPIDFLVMKVVHAWRVLHMKKSKIDEVIELLLDHEIEPLNIVNDVWVFLHNTALMRTRLNRMREVSDKPPKLWTCRCNDFYFERAYRAQLWKQRNVYLNLHHLLSVELDYDVEKDEEEGKAVPLTTLKWVGLTRLLKNICALEDGGFTRQMIRANLMVLYHPPKRILARTAALRRMTRAAPSHILTSSQSVFEQYIRGLDDGINQPTDATDAPSSPSSLLLTQSK